QVRPFPLNFPLKKRAAPCEMTLSSFTDPPDDVVVEVVTRLEEDMAKPSTGGPATRVPDCAARASVWAARSGTRPKRFGGSVVSSNKIAPVLSLTRVKR